MFFAERLGVDRRLGNTILDEVALHPRHTTFCERLVKGSTAALVAYLPA